MDNKFIFIMIIVFWVIILYQKNNSEERIRIIKKNKKGDRIKMIELSKKFIGKECVIHLLSSSSFIATIDEVSNNALLVTRETGGTEIVNIDYIIKICDPPRNKKGKIKAIY